MALNCAALVLLGLAATAVAGPVNSRYSTVSQCAGFCPENTKFGFETGKTYEYDYESAVKTHIPGASADHSTLHMNAVVKLEVLSRCEMALRLESVQLKDVAPGTNRATSAASSRAFASALQRLPLRFAFVSGNVEAVCPGGEEQTWVLNIKRALLSHLQNTMNDFNVDFRNRETDVTGDCPVTYTTESAGWNGVHTIKKSKNLEACTGRLSADTVLQGTAYRTPSNMQSLPLMKGSHECQQKINKQGLLIESACHESHIFRPLSKDSKGATTDVTTKMTFKGETTGVVTAETCGQAKPITFDHTKTREELSSVRTEAERVLRAMCAQTTPGVSASAPSLFGELVRELKKLDVESLVNLHRDLKSGGFCNHAEKYLHDAVPTLGTVASARLIKNLVLSGEVTGAESAMWLNSLAFVQEPTAPMLAEVTPLVSTSPLNRHSALAVSSLVNNFCRHNANCGSTPQVAAITSALEAHLVRGCANAARQHNDVIAALKALGNTGHGDAELLNACMSNAEAAMEVRVTAINAFRRMDCSADKTELTRIFENAELDSELRINAYLALMVCPTPDILIRVRNMLEREEVNQVGSFVWTHLTNLMETSSPLKQEVRQIVEMESLRKEFNIDKRKFSRNIEKSYFSEMLNSGASVESNIIWSPDSFVPRSASVNLTADLFGHSVNLVEIGGRVEGLNGILDDLFDSNTPADANKATTNDINNVDKKFGAKTEAAPQGSGYLRVFGNEIAYADFHDLDASTVRSKFNYLNWLIELAKEHTIDFSKSFQFLDTTVNVATIAGFPLRIHVEGNAVTDIKMKGMLDMRKLATAPRSLIVNGQIAPSAALEVTAEMGVDAFHAQTGIRTVDTIHTSTIADGSIQLRDGRIFAMDIKMPRDKVEIFTAKHDIFIVYRGANHGLNMPANRFMLNKCLSGKFTTVTGMELCAEIAVPDHLYAPEGPFFPLTTPGIVSIALNKRDTFTNYHFEAKALREKVQHDTHMDTVDVALVSFNTPGSRVNRELTVDFSLNHSQKKIEMNVITPWMPRAHFAGALTNTDELKRATALASMGSTSYEALAEVTVVTNKYNTRYMPKFEVKLPSGTTPTVSGTILYRSGRKIDVNVVATDIFSETVNVEGSVTGTKESKKTRYETTLNIKSPLVRGKIDGFVDRTEADGTVYSSRLEVAYKPAGALNNRITFSGKLRNKNNAKKTDVSGTIAFTSNMWARYDTDAKFELLQQGKTLVSSFEGTLAGDKTKSLKIQQNGLLNWGTSMKKATMDLDIKLPYMNIDHVFSASHLYKRDSLKTTISFDKQGADHCLIDIAVARESMKPLKASADIKVQYPGRQMRYQQTIDEVKTKEYRNELSIQLDTDQTIVLTADYKMLPRHQLEAQLTTPFIPPVTFVGHLNPVLSNFAAKASIEHTGEQYAAEATMNLKVNDKRATIQLIHPRRTITSDIEMKRAGKIISGVFETKWDANRDAAKKFKLSGEVSLAKMRPRLSIKAELYPRRFIQVITNGEFTHPNEICNHQGDFTLRSSFANFEEITASFKNKMSPSEITASGQMSWAADKKIDADFTLNLRSGWKSVDANAKLLTPFPEVRRITYQLDYAVEGSTLRANTKGIFNRHNIGLDVTAVADAPRLEGSVTMTSSFAPKIVLAASHVDTGRKCHSDADLTWGNNKKISLIYNMEHARSGYHLNINGDMQVKTPFKGYRNNKISVRHSNDENSVKHHIEVEMFKKQAIYDFDGSFIATGNDRKLNIKTFLTAPTVDWRFTTEHQHNTMNLQGVKTTAAVQWETGKTVQITNDFNLGSGRLQESFKFISPFEGGEVITLDLDNTYSPSGLRAKNELKWPGNKVSFNGEMKRTGNEFDATFQLETPFMPTQKMTMVNNMIGSKWTAGKTYEYAPGKIITLSTSYDRGSTKAYTLDFTSPFEVMKAVNFAIEHTGTERDFTLKSTFLHNLMADKIEMTTVLKTSDLTDLKARFTLTTPTESVSRLQATYSHKLQDDEFKCSGSFEIPSYKATFNHEMAGSLRRFNTKTAVMYKRGQKIELTTNLQSVGTINGGVTFKSPFNEDVTFSFKREGPLTNMKSSFELSFERTKKITGTFEFDNTKGILTSGELTTPFMGYKTLGFTFKNEGTITNLKNDWSVYRENSRMAGQTSFSLEGNTLNIRSNLDTPFSGYENFLFTFAHEGILSNFNCEGHFDYPGGKLLLKNNFILRGNGITLKHEIRTPFQAMRVVIIEADHKGQLENFKNSLSFRLNRNKYEANSNFIIARNAISGSAALLIPEEYSITFRHSGDSSNFNNNMRVKFDGQQISGESTYKYRGNNLDGSLKMLTPFEGFKKFSIAGNHQGPMNNFQCDYTIELDGRRMTISDEFKIDGNRLTAKLDISTPFTTVRNINVNFNHEGPFTDFKNGGFLKINNNRYTGSTEFSLATNSISGSAVLNIPSEYSITFSHSGPSTDFSNSFEIKADTMVIKGDSEFKWINGVELSATLTAPFTDPIVFKYSHSGVLTAFEQEITLTHGSNSYFKKMKFEKKAQQITFEDEIRTPFEPIRTLIIQANHNGKSFKNFRNNIDVIHNGLKRSANVDFKWFSNIFKLRATASIPEDYTLLVKNKIESGKLEADLKITTPSGNIDGSCQLEATDSATTGSFVLTTPFTYFRSQSLNFEHKVGAGIESKLNIITSLPAFKSFEAILTHEGTFERFTTSGNVNLDSERMSFTVSHQGHMLDFTSSASASMNDETISTQMSFKKETNGKITSSGVITTPFTGFEKMTFNMNHEGSLTDFSSSASVARNNKALNGQVNFKKTGNKVTSTGYINTPFTNFEKMTFNINHEGLLTDFKSTASIAKNEEAITAEVLYKKAGPKVIFSGSMNTPFSGFERMHYKIDYNGNPTDFSSRAVVAMNDETITADMTFKKADNTLASSVSIRTPFTSFREMTASINHNGQIDDFSSSASAALNNQAINGEVTYKKTGNKITTSGTINTPFPGLEKMVISLDHDGHLTDFETSVAAAINADRITSSVMFKKAGKKVTTSLAITTPFRNYERMNIALEGHLKDISSTVSVTVNGKTASFEVTYKKTGNTISSVGSLNLPITNFERFAYTFNHEGTLNNFRTTIQVNTPFRNVDASYSHKGNMKDFECEARIESDGQRYETDLKFKLGDSSLETEVSIETPHRKYENFGINMKHMTTSRGIKSSVNVQTPFDGYKALGAELQHDGEINDFRTTGTVNGASWPIKFSVAHKGDWSAFTTEGSVDFMNNQYTGSNGFKYTDGNVDATGSLRLPMGVYRYSLKHLFTARGFTTEGSINTPHEGYEQAAFDLTHEGTLNNFATSGKINAFRGEGSFNVNHRGTIQDFTTSANAEWDHKRINGEVAFKTEAGNMETHATVTTPFAGYERFHAEAKHNKEGRKMKTEVNIETPFRQIRDPSFVVEHRGHWKNFKTLISLTTPFKHIKPMVMNINHHGIPKDFTSTGTFRYGTQTSTANARFERNTNGFTASADLSTPFEEAKKFGFNMDHSFDGRTLNTKASIETPHQEYKNFGVEVNHEGNLRKFMSSGKIESPFFKPVTFEMNHDGELTDFQSRGFVQQDGQKIEGEARYQKADKSHDGFIRIATPFSYLKNAEATLSHVHDTNYDFSGNLKGSYNTHKFDGDYSAVNKRTKSGSITLRHPQPMEYSYSVTPSDGRAEALVNWDATTTEKQIRFEATLKNVADGTTTDREVALTMRCPHDTHKMTAGYKKTDNTLSAKAEFESSRGKFTQEVELTKNTRGREVIYDGSFKTVSPMVNFEMNGNHKVNAGRRYMTEINIITSETLQIRSDIKTPSETAYSSTFIIKHPRFTKNIVIGVDGNIDTKKNNYEGKIDLEYAREKITFTGKIADESNRYRTKVNIESSLKHPSNKVDVSFKSNFLDNRKILKFDSEFTYLMSANNRKNVMTGTVDFNKNTEEVVVKVATPVKSFDITGSRTISDASRQHFSISGSVDGETMRAEVDVDRTVPSIITTLDYAPESTLHMFAKYHSRDHFTLEAYRQVSGRKIPETAFDVEIVGGHLVKGRAFLRPGTVSDLSDLFSIDSGLGRFYSDISQTIANDLRLKVPGFKRAIEPAVNAMEFISQGFGAIAQRTEVFFSSNQFYTRDIARAISGFFGDIRTIIDGAIADTIEAISSVELLYREAAAKYDECRQVAVRYYNSWYQQAAAKMTEYRVNFHKKVAAHITNMQGSLLDLVEAIRNKPYVKSFLDSLQAKGERIIERITELADNMAAAAEQLLNRPEFSTIRHYVNKANEKTAWIFEYINMEVRAREWLHQIKDAGLTPFRRAAWTTVRELLHLEETRINTWAPERGEIAGQVYIPMLMRDLNSMPTLNVGGFIDNIKRHIPDTDWVLWDTLYAYKPSSDIRDWLPPFKSHATIAGNQHYMTFDKKFFEFAGECSYLLARDFIDGTFSVVVNYENRNNIATKKSLTVVHGTNTVEILPDFRVEVNGRRSELPIISEHTAVYRVGNTLRIDNDHGVKITCNLPNDHCTVAVTGWYFGKTAGLLGTYDNEHTTDFKKVTGERASTPEEFATSWTVGRQCRAINHAVQEEVSPIHRNFEQCATIFQAQTSAFRPCFKQRDPAPFMKMCVNGDMCKVASFYVAECKMMEVPIRMPKQCVTCQLPSGAPMSEGQEETVRGTEIPKKADVVFVVSHGECNEDAITKMNQVANQVLSSMKTLGVNDVHFGLVGYGGEGREASPHSHTMDGQLTNSKTTFLQTIKNFHTSASNNEDEDALAAMEFASHYAFRAGASKSIVLMPCAKCSTKNVAYSTIQAALSDQDIKFHMLIHEDFKLSAYSKSPKTSYMYGIDRENVFTAKDARGNAVRGDRDLRRHTVPPKDLCVALSHETDGSVFNLLKLTETASDKQKRFATVLGRVVAKKGAPAECQRCECRSDESGVGVTKCHPCVQATPYIYTWDGEGLPEPDVPFSKARSL